MAPKIVSFERSPAFVYSRAMLQRRKNRSIDALELLRSAVEREPGNNEYRMDLAEMHSMMGMIEKSNRILLDMICAGGAPAECWLGLAMNARSAGNEDAAKRAMAAYRKRVGEEDYNAAMEIAEENDPFLQEMIENGRFSRRELRAMHTAARAGELLSDNIDRACALFERSIEQGADTPEVQSMYTLALADSGDEDEAISRALSAMDDPLSDVHELSIAAQALLICGQQDDARAAVKKALDLRPNTLDMRLLICVMDPLNMYSEMAEAIRLALQESPYDRRMMHIRALALHRAGARDSECAAIWRKLLRMDPDDANAMYWLKAAETGRLSGMVTSITQTLPEERIREIVLRFNMILLKGESVDPNEYPGLRSELEWALSLGNRECQIAAGMILTMCDDAESRSQLREVMYREYVHADAKKCVFDTLTLLGKDHDMYLPPEELAPRGYYPSMKHRLRELPAYERQMIRFADSVLYEDYGISAGTELAEMWCYYKNHTVHNKLVCTQEAAAALAWNMLLAKELRPDVVKLSEQFECRKRRMVYYARHMAGVIEGAADRYENRRS